MTAVAAHVNGMVAADPVTQALTAAAEAGAGRALTAHLPKLTLTRAEAAETLGVSLTTVDQFLRDDTLDRIAAGRITLASVLRLAGWPLCPAPLAAPLASIPAVAS